MQDYSRENPMDDIILCITEGEKTEILFLKDLIRHFLPNNRLRIIPFCADIYQLYAQMQSDDFFDLLPLLQSRNNNQDINQYTREQIAQIYLFFDYDGHATNASDEKITEMLEYFNNETEKGKLYISYPMVEALKDSLQDPSDRILTSPVSSSDYKELVHGRGPCIFQQLRKTEKSHWCKQLNLHLKIGHYIVSNQPTLPSSDEIKKTLTQSNIFSQQQTKYIKPTQSVAVLSPFAFFLVEYTGKLF